MVDIFQGMPVKPAFPEKKMVATKEPPKEKGIW